MPAGNPAGYNNVFSDPSFFRDLLEEQPELAFFSFQNQFGRSPNQRRFFENQFSDIHNQFLGTLGAQIRGGQLPTAQFTPFLEAGFGPGGQFQQQFGALPPSQRGMGIGRFAPSAQFVRPGLL